MTTAQTMAMKFRQRDSRREAEEHTRLIRSAIADRDERRREREEQRPKNAGVHADQNRKHRTRSNRRADNQELRQYRYQREA